MSLYNHVLLAADFTNHSDNNVAHKAKAIAECNQAMLSIVHIVDNLPIAEASYGPVIPFDVDITDELMKASKQQLAKLATGLGVPENRQWLEIGSPKMEIVRIADENDVDLIIVGSHGRHGLALLLGSTANGVLHHAKCDVLAVRLQDD